ncbi:MAG: polysaccharide ABC transporter ATP-binding protein [Chitinophagaceae bacterium]
MSNTVIKVEHISKLYRLGQVGTGTLSHDLNRIWARLRGREDPTAKLGETNDRSSKGEGDFVWSLQDINFEIAHGEVVGIIGRNGAGKSTLLKILSRTTSPTAGNIKIKGRVASLLEVGTGFHPELTGKENIYLNGAILGMNKAEINKKFDEIVDFSGVERYIDTPVKRYSSGMYVRLAFAVAANLDTDILIIDEVLAVGDAEFQKKCLGKMNDVSKNEGRTVLFVSHQMGTIAQLCTRSMMFDKGKLVTTGPTNEVISYYLQQAGNQVEKIERPPSFPGNHFGSIQMVSSSLSPKVNFSFEEEILVQIELRMPDFNPVLELAMRLTDKHKYAVFTIHEKIEQFIEGDTVTLVVTIPPHFLMPGRYSWIMCINHPGYKLYDLQDDILPFNIIETGSVFARYEGGDNGNVFAKYTINKI